MSAHKRTRLLFSSPHPMKSPDVSEFNVTKEKQQITLKSREMLAAIFITMNSSWWQLSFFQIIQKSYTIKSKILGKIGTSSLVQNYSWYSTVFIMHAAINRALTLYLWAVAWELCRNPALLIYTTPVLWVSMYSYPRHDSQSQEYFICFQHNTVLLAIISAVSCCVDI